MLDLLWKIADAKVIFQDATDDGWWRKTYYVGSGYVLDINGANNET